MGGNPSFYLCLSELSAILAAIPHTQFELIMLSPFTSTWVFDCNKLIMYYMLEYEHFIRSCEVFYKMDVIPKFHCTLTWYLKIAVFLVASGYKWKMEEKQRKKGKSLSSWPATPSHTDLKWSDVIEQFQLCLRQTSPFIHVLRSLPLWPDCTGTGRDFPPLWKDKNDRRWWSSKVFREAQQSPHYGW